MRTPGNRERSRAGWDPFSRFLVGLALPFVLATGGVGLAAWAMDANQEVLGIVGLSLAAFGFFWLFILNFYVGSLCDAGEATSLSVYVIIALIALGGGAAVIVGVGLLGLALLAAPVLIIIAIWGAISSGFSFFD